MNYNQRPTTTEELQTLVANKLDVMEFLDIIGYTMYDLVEVLRAELDENFEELLAACN
jgi:hypothetical protein